MNGTGYLIEGDSDDVFINEQFDDYCSNGAYELDSNDEGVPEDCRLAFICQQCSQIYDLHRDTYYI